jgi:hypothetical protein
MHAKTVKEAKAIAAQPFVRPDDPALPARQRLHANIERLRLLDKQLYWDQLEQAELLTAIQLVGFKIEHLAWQIQNEENLRPTI